MHHRWHLPLNNAWDIVEPEQPADRILHLLFIFHVCLTLETDTILTQNIFFWRFTHLDLKDFECIDLQGINSET